MFTSMSYTSFLLFIQYFSFKSNKTIILVLHFRWDNKTFSIWGGLDGGPLYLFNRKSDALFISAFSEFMVGSPYHDQNKATYGWGIMGSVKSIPARFKYETIIYYSGEGIRQVGICIPSIVKLAEFTDHWNIVFTKLVRHCIGS